MTPFSIEDGQYDVFIDSTLEDGALTYGELYLQGQVKEEVLISCHACHPSLANDNLSGVSLATLLAKHLSLVNHRYSYRFLFIPGTIGAIAWLALNEEKTAHIKHGLVLAGVGDGGNLTYKKSRRGDAEIDRVSQYVLRTSGREHNVEEFSPYGYDERQYCSPGFNLPVGRISRTPFGQYPEYHTSADNLGFVKEDCLLDTFQYVADILFILENNRTFINKKPKCEPQLGKRGLYHSAGGAELAMLWVLNFSDGGQSLLDISEKSGIPFKLIRSAADVLVKYRLIERKEEL